MDSGILALVSSIAVSLFTSITTIFVAQINSKKTREEVADEVASINEQLAKCEARDAKRHVEVTQLTQRVYDLERTVTNLRAGKPSDWSPLGPPET